MQRWWRAAVLSIGFCGPLSGCAIYRPYEVVRIWGDWNTERQLNIQVTHYSHLPLKPVRVRLATWAYNPGKPGAPVPPRSGSPATTVVPADALPPPPPVPPAEDPSGIGIPPIPMPPPPPIPSPPAPTTESSSRDLLDLARPPRVPSSKAPGGDKVLPNTPGRILPQTAPDDESDGIGPTAQTPSSISPSLYQTSAPPRLVPSPEPRKAHSAAWLFTQ
jgi:hypothetical protein